MNSQIEKISKPEYIFESSWEVCHKIGGIYTVLSTRAKTMQERFPNRVFFIGPYLKEEKQSTFVEDRRKFSAWVRQARREGLNVKVGYWDIPGQPCAILVDFQPFYLMKDRIYAEMWDAYNVDSLHGYGDYDEASMFSYAAGQVVASFYRYNIRHGEPTIYQAHEWMTGLGLLWIKKNYPQIATIFTTHATSIGRSICGNGKPLYDYFEGYHGDQMARELNMESKHSVEKQAAHYADCFTTVSRFTARECHQLLDKDVDVVLVNGFESDFVPVGAKFTSKRKKAREKMLSVANALTGETFPDDTVIISTSGRNDFRCKGFDVYMGALAQLNKANPQRDILAFIEVPCWTMASRHDLEERLASGEIFDKPLEIPMITHTLYNMDEDRILNMIKSLNLWNTHNDRVKVILVPCYLDGNDGIFNLSYYDLLIGNDLCIYPSYYEPWGYTPLESIAFHIPCITTDLSGFGQWVNDTLLRVGTLSDGVCVLHRTDSNYDALCHEIRDQITNFVNLSVKEITGIRKKAKALSQKALWKNFIVNYDEAYTIALQRAQKRNENKTCN